MGTKARIKAEDDTINGIQQAGGKGTAEATRLREEIKNLEATIEKCEEDKNTKDSQIRTLRDEISHQGDLIGKLSKVKGKLEQSLDECEDTLEREKKSKADVEK